VVSSVKATQAQVRCELEQCEKFQKGDGVQFRMAKYDPEYATIFEGLKKLTDDSARESDTFRREPEAARQELLAEIEVGTQSIGSFGQASAPEPAAQSPAANPPPGLFTPLPTSPSSNAAPPPQTATES
jgi:hypothetical protein